MSDESISLTYQNDSPQRLDAFLASALSSHSRARLQALIKSGEILLNGQKTKARTSLKKGDSISGTIAEPLARVISPEEIPLEILAEDESVVVVNKAPGMVVHPAAGNDTGTLVHALLHHCQGQLADEGGDDRPGIVHRLDKDTSGCLIVAKTNPALKNLTGQFADRKPVKLYLAVAQSPPKKEHQTVFNNIARHPVHRQRMDVCNPGAGKPAITDLHLLHQADDGTSLFICALHTGRTHQIRIHQRFLGHPLLGDPIYAKPTRQPINPGRLMLHAWRLGLNHPTSGKWLQSEAPVPPQFSPWTLPVEALLETIRAMDPATTAEDLWRLG